MLEIQCIGDGHRERRHATVRMGGEIGEVGIAPALGDDVTDEAKADAVREARKQVRSATGDDPGILAGRVGTGPALAKDADQIRLITLVTRAERQKRLVHLEWGLADAVIADGKRKFFKFPIELEVELKPAGELAGMLAQRFAVDLLLRQW